MTNLIVEPTMPASSLRESGLSRDQNAKIIEMIFLASDLAQSCDELAPDPRGLSKELMKSVNKSIALLRRLLSESEQENVGASYPRARLTAIVGGVEDAPCAKGPGLTGLGGRL